MAILNIITEEDERLRKKSRAVDEITPRIITLLDDMRETLIKANGAGLAAVQVGVLRRIALVCYEEGNIIELINPEIISAEGEQDEVEGCLSLPDKWGLVKRPETVTVKAMNRSGEEFTVTASGLGARAFCHEIDHLDGIIYTDKAYRMLTAEELEELYE
ncbi:MAG: peptide deformylase [Ruminococcaceae bacterium]|nr:peptide deformylase [Oscillospiraceae bacterium]